MLSPRDAVQYLLSRDLIDREWIFGTDLVVANASRRNWNYRVITPAGPCYLLKQGIGVERAAAIAHEASVYHLLHSRIGMASYLPQLYLYDPAEQILALELFSNAQSLTEYRSTFGFSLSIAKAMGRALAILHKTFHKEAARVEAAIGHVTYLPWILNIHHPNIALFCNISNANLDLIKIIQQFPEFCGLLDELQQDWREETLIHNDIKADNCIVYRATSSLRRRRLAIVDWELSCYGDPCWDVGSVFSDFLSLWLDSMPITGETTPEEFFKLARFPIETLQPSISAFWASYSAEIGLEQLELAEQLLRSVKYAAARLVQSAYEQLQMSWQISGTTVCLLQLSLNMLRRPQEASDELLGLSTQ